MNPYEVLGVDRDADDEEIKSAYREKAKEHHPDQGGDAEKFKDVQEAYEQIQDGGDSGGFDPGPFSAGGPAGFGGPNSYRDDEKSVEDFIREFEEFARQGGFDGPGFSGDPFHGGAKQQIVYEVPIDFREAVTGGKSMFRVGSSPTGSMTGETKEVDIPAGIHDGDTINHSEGFTVKFRVNNNTEFWRKNKNDIYTRKEVSVWDAMTGAEVQVETITGQIVSLTIDSGTQPGEIYRLPDLGGPQTYNGKLRGDMYVEIEIEIPEVTETKRNDLVDQLRELDQGSNK